MIQGGVFWVTGAGGRGGNDEAETEQQGKEVEGGTLDEGGPGLHGPTAPHTACMIQGRGCTVTGAGGQEGKDEAATEQQGKAVKVRKCRRLQCRLCACSPSLLPHLTTLTV